MLQTIFIFSMILGQMGSNWLSSAPNTLTVWWTGSIMPGSVALLAHDYLAGSNFTSIQPGDIIDVPAFGVYQITEWKFYSRSQYPGYLISPEGALVTETEIIGEVYMTEDRLVLQTCINNDQGFLFVIGQRISNSNNTTGNILVSRRSIRYDSIIPNLNQIIY